MTYKPAPVQDPRYSLNRFIIFDAPYERFLFEWNLYSEWVTHTLPQDDEILGRLFYSCIQYNKLRVLAFLLKNNTIPLLLDPHKVGTTAVLQEFFSKFPLYSVIDNSYFRSWFKACNRPALLRLILYCRGMEPFETMTDHLGYNAVWHYTHEKAKDTVLSNGETIGVFMNRAWQEIQFYHQLLAEARELVSKNNYVQAYEKFTKAALQLRAYSEGDEGLNCFYEEEMFAIYREAVDLMNRDRLSMVHFIATQVFSQIKYLKKDHDMIKYFETMMHCPAPSAIPAHLERERTPSHSSSESSEDTALLHASPEGLRHRRWLSK